MFRSRMSIHVCELHEEYFYLGYGQKSLQNIELVDKRMGSMPT